MNDIRRYLATLRGYGEGGWGYAAGQPAHLEPTCLALLALALDREQNRADIDKGFLRLQACTDGDGTYRLPRGRDEAVWPTALVLFVQAALGRPEEEIQRTGSRLLALKGRLPDQNCEADLHDIDVHLQGWSWANNNFSWVEPTAWSCLALRRAGYGDHARVEEGLRLLLDRATDEGGINYGNRHLFGRLTLPIPGTTALMLLALQGRDDQPRVHAAITYLQREIDEGDDLENLCWGKLALDVYRDRPGLASWLTALDNRIVAAHGRRAATPWIRPSPLREALTALALAANDSNYFRLAGTETHKQSPAVAAPSDKAVSWTGRIKGYFRSVALEGAGRLRQCPSPSQVHVASVNDYQADLAGILHRQYGAFRARVPLAGKRVVLKPNIVEYRRGRVINTDPAVVAAAIDLCKKEGAGEILVADGPGHFRNAEHLVSASGLGQVLADYRVTFVDLNHDEPIKTLNLGRLTGLDYLYQAQTIATADVVISLAKMKTHHWAGATLSLKNMFGTLPGICYGWPKNELHWRGIENSIVDIALTRPPDLAIVDGIIGMEGDGPLNGTAKALGVLVMGSDCLAVDATCCRLMMLDPQRVDYLVLGQRKKLGLLREEEIQQIGERIDALARPFETLPHFHQLYLGRSA